MTPPFVTSARLSALSRVAQGFFGRQGGTSVGDLGSLNMSFTQGDDAARVEANRALAVDTLGLAGAPLVVLKQVHSARSITFDAAPEGGATIEADSMATRTPGVVLGILTADCAPILLADPEAGVIGAAHAGWKGAADKVIANTVAAMVELGADPARIVAAIGPTISQPNYEVGPDFATALLKKRPRAAPRIMAPRGGIEHFDLPGFIGDELRRAGVAAIDDLALCTYELEAEYFSHRRATHRGTRAGRQISLIALR